MKEIPKGTPQRGQCQDPGRGQGQPAPTAARTSRANPAQRQANPAHHCNAPPVCQHCAQWSKRPLLLLRIGPLLLSIKPHLLVVRPRARFAEFCYGFLALRDDWRCNVYGLANQAVWFFHILDAFSWILTICFVNVVDGLAVFQNTKS